MRAPLRHPRTCNPSLGPSILTLRQPLVLVPKRQHFLHIGSEFASFGHEIRPLSGNGLMRSGHFGRQVRLGAGTLMVLMVHSFCAPGAAEASCSHRIGSSSTLISHRYALDDLIMGGSTSVSEGGLDQSPHHRSVPGPRVPCSGLSCSSKVPLPVSTASMRNDRSDQWGMPGILVVLDAPVSPVRINDEAYLHSLGQNSSIFHPPRV
jgi:hypothetical protein